MSLIPDLKDIKNENVILGKEEFEDLVKRSLFLDALIISGVDNWEWYGEAVDVYKKLLLEAGYDPEQ